MPEPEQSFKFTSKSNEDKTGIETQIELDCNLRFIMESLAGAVIEIGKSTGVSPCKILGEAYRLVHMLDIGEGLGILKTSSEQAPPVCQDCKQ